MSKEITNELTKELRNIAILYNLRTDAGKKQAKRSGKRTLKEELNNIARLYNSNFLENLL